MPYISAAELTKLTGEIFCNAGLPADEAEALVSSLVESDLHGHESHGVARVESYLKALEAGEVTVNASTKILRESAAIISMSGGGGFGPKQMAEFLDRVSEKARSSGVATGTLVEVHHIGRVGAWTHRLAERGFAALIATNDNGTFTAVAPPGGLAARVSTNPISISVPNDSEPMTLDMSTSAVASGKILVAYQNGTQCDPGWLQDQNGNPTTDPGVRFPTPTGTILPMGGAESHKGFGLALMLDLLISGLTGGYSWPAPEGASHTNPVLCVAWSPEHFAGHTHLIEQVSKLSREIHNTPRKPSVAEILLPGERGLRCRKQRLQKGIPLSQRTWEMLTRLAAISLHNAPH